MSELLKVEHLTKVFGYKKNQFIAVDDVSFSINKGESVGIIGESGSGKSTIARLVAGFEANYSGNIVFQGQILNKKNGIEKRREMQMIFQNPKSSLNPSMKIRDCLLDSIRYTSDLSKEEMLSRINDVITKVQLPLEYLEKYPNQISGGECQRVCIAKSILKQPSLLICDEITSALDASVQKEILELLISIRNEYNMGLLFITHDIAVVSQICSSLIVLKDGKIVEQGNLYQILMNPKAEYTKNLLDSVIQLE